MRSGLLRSEWICSSADLSKTEMVQVDELLGVRGWEITEGLKKDGQPSP